jgi:transcriptional regulator with XRE-family HTH domain
MRRVMLAMTQTELGDGVGITFQQIQKYENGMNRVSASRLQQISQVLQVLPEFFFEGAPDQFNTDGKKPTADYVSEFLSTCDGLALARAFTRLPNAKLRRSLVALVERIAGE